MRSQFVVSVLFLLGFNAAISLGQTSPSASDEDAIRKADVEWSRAAKLATLDTFLTFYADDASVLPFNAPLVTGKDSIRQFFTQLFSRPGWNVSFGPTRIAVSKSRDIAYEIGTAQITFNDAQGQPVTTPAKYVVAWRKDSHHQWKAVADIFNTDR